MTVLVYTLKRLFRNKLNLLLILVIPALAIGLFLGFGNFGSSTLSVGIVDLDNSVLTGMMAKSLSETSRLVPLNEDDIRTALASGRVDYILVIEPGFSSQIVNNQSPSLQGYSIQETNMSQPIKLKVEGFLGAAKSLAHTAAGNETAFYKGMEDYLAGSFVIDSESYGEAGKRVDAAMGGMGLLAMTMMLLSTFTATKIIKDRENHTFFRVLSSTISLKSYMVQYILCFLTILLCQVVVVLLIVQYVFGFYMGPSVLSVYFVMAVFALLCVSMGVALSSLVRTTQQAGTVASMIITPMCMLGGLFWPRWLMPEILQTIGEFLPTTWVMTAVHKVMLGNPISSAVMDISILLGFTVVFFLLGTWRRADITR